MRIPLKRVLLIIVAVVALSGAHSPTAGNAATGRSLKGAWQGSLSVQGMSLRIVFNFAVKSGGGYLATLDSPDQGAKGIPVDTVVVGDTLVRVSVGVIGGLYEGKWLHGADSIVGMWSQRGMSLPLTIRYVGEQAEALKRPQEPKRPFPYKDEDVSYPNSRAGITLAGTLTLPEGSGPFPAVVLITGSGPQDRDETVFGHRPFLVLSDYLTRRGIAVLRSDDRGIGKSTGEFGSATSRDLAGDVESAVNYLKSRREVRPECIGLVGHSEGGIIAPIVAVDAKGIAFIVLMAGTGVTGEELILKQAALISAAMGASESDLKKQNEMSRQMYAVVKGGDDSITTYAKLKALYRSFEPQTDSAGAKQSQGKDQMVDAQIHEIMSPWFRYFLSYDPRPMLKKVACPVLAINGEKDLQVPPKQNLPEIEKALTAGGNKQFTVRELPGLNHLFQHAVKGTPDEYTKSEETISPDALDLIGNWISAQCKLMR